MYIAPSVNCGRRIPLYEKSGGIAMGDGFRRFVEFATDSPYVPLGAKCDICKKKLGFFATGFWSTNTKHVVDGNLCKACDERIQTLIRDKKRWMSKRMQENSPLAGYTLGNWRTMTLQQAKQLLELKELADRGELEQYGESASTYLIVREAFWIEPKATEVGVARAKRLAKKMVVYGRVEQGMFAKGDAVRIDNEGKLLDAHVLEAYEDDGENTFEAHVRAHMGKQRLLENQTGWLLLDLEWGVFPENRIIK